MHSAEGKNGMIPLTWQVKGIIAGIALAAVLGIGVKVYSAGKAAGRGDGAREQLDIDKKSMEQERADFQAKLSAGERTDAAAQLQIEQQQLLIDNATSLLSKLGSARAQGQKDLAAVPDAALVADVRRKLNVEPAETSPTLTSTELRQVDSEITDYAPLRDSFQALSDKQAATERTIAELNVRVGAIASERDAALQFSNEMVGHYTKAYNAAQKRHSKIVTVLTLGLVRNKKLDLPDPVTLSPAK
jgi:chromosome segregation ATPase